jgi:hypothetical protein
MSVPASASPRLICWVLAALIASVGLSADAVACTTPVFRYAMDLWPADLYEVHIYHTGGAGGEAIEQIRRIFRGAGAAANVVVRGIDTTAVLTPHQRQLWTRSGQPELPWMLVVTPPGGVLYQGRPDMEEVTTILSSPRRQELGERLIQGEAAVWILLESGDEDADNASAALLQAELQRFTAVGHPDSATAATLWSGARFSLLRLARDDPRETALVDMLLLTEPDLRELEGPIVFPVFGRGRVLYALVGAGITVPNIVDACTFVAGECSCQAKELNPGVDLLLSVDWDRRLEDAAEEQIPLSGGLVGGEGQLGEGRDSGGTGILSFLLGTSVGRRLGGVVVAGLVVIALVTWGVMRR